ncbi:helix-turn-helix domain-containing protein [Flavobacterium piscisymbiosum]|uniref:Helix-turn-helix domain-containing protein n=1 Tax=Flavobacterium piscisymbiosum TaxID=2893753 RepID=A0ABS8MDV2_9FLAO|nr:helix-turn-helix domain-containing protein [Flavobacterium sp. F-30]MCC9063656.1 helix-turn-helix domain-containing protein [Flavobacterium sp. F-30]
MIKEILNTEVKTAENDGLLINVIKNYTVKNEVKVPFQILNFSVLLIKAGNLRIQFSSQGKVIRRRDLFVIPANSICTHLETTDNIQLYLIRTSVDFVLDNCYKKELADAFSILMLQSDYKIKLEEKDFTVLSMIYKLMYFLQCTSESREIYNDLKRISFNLFMYELKVIYSKYVPDANLDFSRKESFVIQFLTVLAIHYKKQHHVQFYAGALYVTPGHLNKMVKLRTGKSAKTFIIDALITEAKNLLEDSQDSIAKISDELEFSSAANFSVFFKRHTSILPSEYRSNKNHTL